jgi:hypothetical protein
LIFRKDVLWVMKTQIGIPKLLFRFGNGQSMRFFVFLFFHIKNKHD